MKIFTKTKLLLSLFSIIILFLMISSYFFYDLKKFSSRPTNLTDTNKIFFNINKGQSFTSVARKLEQNGLINNFLKFKIYAKLNSLGNKIQAGEYVLSKSMSPGEILNIFISGKINLYKITIPEGYTIFQTAEAFENSSLCSKSDFLKASYDKQRLLQFSIPGENLEGYLFPDTYFFPKNINAQDIVKKMTENFFNHFSKEFKETAHSMGFSMHQIVTLASIIEKETGADFERPIISSVFHNRLKKNMRLETDPSVIYGIQDFNGNITKKDLRRKTPYNTYIIKGLPKGPIANPGIESIKAALFPAKTDFLFFVSKKDGTHYFSKTYNEHKKAVNKYQLGR